MSMVFTVGFDVTDMEGKSVLVFLKPVNPQRNVLIHAWRVLTGAPGGSLSFSYDGAISTDVSSAGWQPGSSIVSARADVLPGQLYSVVSPSGLSPELQLAPASLAQTTLTPEQAGVINQTNPFIQFDSNWYVDSQPVMTAPHVDTGMTVVFQCPPTLYFMVAPAPMAGQTYIVQNFLDMTEYPVPASASAVNVTLTRDQGLWVFKFQALPAAPAGVT